MKLKFQYFGYLMPKADSFEKTLTYFTLYNGLQFHPSH